MRGGYRAVVTDEPMDPARQRKALKRLGCRWNAAVPFGLLMLALYIPVVEQSCILSEPDIAMLLYM